jgi:hypothetical protein
VKVGADGSWEEAEPISDFREESSDDMMTNICGNEL